MKINIRKAISTDCERMMELVKELAIFERAPNEVTVTPEHFVESGFGKNPVWYALVACAADDPMTSGSSVAGANELRGFW